MLIFFGYYLVFERKKLLLNILYILCLNYSLLRNYDGIDLVVLFLFVVFDSIEK